MKWMQINKRADFQAIGRRFGIDQVTARIIRNRDVIGDDAVDAYLHGGLERLHDPHLLYDADRLVAILRDKIHRHKPIRIIGDYDIDGVMSSYILMQGLKNCGAVVSTKIPERMKDGYGLNVHLIDEAYADGADTILTCDNGISAIDEIAHAADLGMTVLVTDHHEVPYRLEGEERVYLHSRAAAVVNPHQPECAYPFKDLCGAAVAWKIICLLYEAEGIAGGMGRAVEEFIENVAFATVGDIMDLTGENRILVREGLKRIHHTQNIGMKALIARCGIEPEKVEAYHFGFVLGPCVNASGRLDTAQRALSLFFEQDPAEADRIAEELCTLNQERKAMTEEGVQEALALCESPEYANDPVLVLYLPDVHESIAGIIAGRVREKYYKPTFILTDAQEGIKGSGRSVEGYSMYEEMCKCQECFLHFGGHPMAAGLTLNEGCLDTFRERINTLCPPEARHLEETAMIDVPMPVSYASVHLVKEFDLLAPFGKGNPKPLFADRNLAVRRLRRVGKEQNVLQMTLGSQDGYSVPGVFFGDIEAFEAFVTGRFGARALADAYAARPNPIRMSVLYSPKVNVYMGREELQIEVLDYH